MLVKGSAQKTGPQTISLRPAGRPIPRRSLYDMAPGLHSFAWERIYQHSGLKSTQNFDRM